MLRRFSSRRAGLYESFLKNRLTGAKRYHRITGYFKSSLLDLASEELAAIPEVRIVCNTDVNPEDVRVVRMATGPRRAELEGSLLRTVWNGGNFPHVVDVHGKPAKERFRILHDLLTGSGKDGRVFEIRIVPDAEFGFVHGKGGVIEADWGRTGFIGSANDSKSAWNHNYELVWEDDSEDSIAWLTEEFDALWEKGFPLSEFMVKQIGRLSRRTLLEHIGEWKKSPEPEPLLAEVPTATELFGFWDHQKYFINLAFNEHQKYSDDPKRGARFLLGDGVGLGKTLQLGAVAKLIGALENRPILILAPKPLLPQWQEELMSKLSAPSARWENGGWITERDEFHPALPEKLTNCPRKIGLVSTSAITSARLSPRNADLLAQLLKLRFSCVIWDEAHKIRRANLAPANVFRPPEKKRLYEFAEQIAAQTRTFLLATATPVQIHPMELWDLLNILSVNNPQVLGDPTSFWRRTSDSTIFDIIAGRADVDDLYQKWQYWRNPLPAALDLSTDIFQWVRQDLGLEATDDIATSADFDRLEDTTHSELDYIDLREINPFTQWVIKRTRDRLEAEGKLVKIEMVSFGDDRPIVCSHGMEQALELAEDFAKALHKRVKASGFIKTLLQRRVGSSLIAGLKTAERMLAGRDFQEDENPGEDAEAMYPLRDHEIKLLSRLKEHLEAHLETEDDPKFERVRDVLRQDFEGKTWLERGVLIFSQFYDSAFALCEYLRTHFEEDIGLYSASDTSKLFQNRQIHSVDRELLKEKVTRGRLKILVGTDAASTGLNLQKLGSLVNLDLPWNPTMLEQRKGRVQRGTIAKRIPFYNMRYDKGVEQRLFDTLSGRIEEITSIFGAIPDFIVDRWVKDMLEDRKWDQNTLFTIISERKQNPFSIKETRESLDADWDGAAEVLNQKDVYRELVEGW